MRSILNDLLVFGDPGFRGGRWQNLVPRYSVDICIWEKKNPAFRPITDRSFGS